MSRFRVTRDGPEWLMGEDGVVMGYRDRIGRFHALAQDSQPIGDLAAAGDSPPVFSAAQAAGLAAGNVVDADGGVFALSEAQPVVTLTATGTAAAVACEFRGIVVRAISGTPQTVTVYDATSATGTPVADFTIAALGAYYWDGDWATAGNGNGGRRVNATGCHVVITGGTSRTIDVMVAAS